MSKTVISLKAPVHNPVTARLNTREENITPSLRVAREAGWPS